MPFSNSTADWWYCQLPICKIAYTFFYTLRIQISFIISPLPMTIVKTLKHEQKTRFDFRVNQVSKVRIQSRNCSEPWFPELPTCWEGKRKKCNRILNWNIKGSIMSSKFPWSFQSVLWLFWASGSWFLFLLSLAPPASPFPLPHLLAIVFL